MDWDEYALTEFGGRATARLNAVRADLIARGVQANRITVAHDATAPNLRYRITATRGARSLVCYVELVSVGELPNDQGQAEMAVEVRITLEADGVPVALAYTPGPALRYVQDMPDLVAKLASVESAFDGEIITRARAALAV